MELHISNLQISSLQNFQHSACIAPHYFTTTVVEVVLLQLGDRHSRMEREK